MKLSELTALYSDLDWDYNNAMSGPYEDLRVTNEDCQVVAGLKDGKITGAWRPMVAVGSDKALKKQIERLWKISNDITYMDFLVNGELSVISRFLLSQGYRARPYYTQIVDVTKTVEELRADLRKSYKSLINAKVKVNLNSIYAAQYLYKKFKQKNRNEETWFIQRRMETENQLFALIQECDINKDDELEDGYVVVYHNGYCAYYASGACQAGAKMHRLVWGMLLHAKNGLGCKYFELGEQVFTGNPKLVNISKFKRGFGGKTQVRLILEK